MVIRPSSTALRSTLSIRLCSHDLSRSITRAYFHSDSSLKQPLQSRSQSSDGNVTKSVKDYAALPHSLIKDGAPVDPLPAWNGGLIPQDNNPEPSKKTKPARARKGTKSSVARKKPKKPEKPEESDDNLVFKSTRRVTKAATSGEVQEDEEETEADLDLKQAIQRPPRSPLARQITENFEKFPGCILLTRVGNFYESYFEQAIEVAKLLSIKLATRKWEDRKVWMCGFPVMHQDKYLKVLVQKYNRRVALCEEFAQPRESFDSILSKPTYERRVARILTPGTLIDEAFLNPYENNFLLSISTENHTLLEDSSDPESTQSYGLAWIDVSTGEFFTRSTDFYSLRNHIVRISPGEIVIPKEFEEKTEHPLQLLLKELEYPLSYVSDTIHQPELISDEVNDDIVNDNASPVSSSVFSPPETSAIAILNNFLQASLMDHAPQTLRPVREEKSRRMQIDAHTLKSLEIRENIREGGVSGSLMNSIKRTVTESGTRLLARWLCSPSTSVEEILARQALVQFFKDRETLRTDLTFLLKKSEDTTRIVQRILLKRGSFDNLISICNTIDIWNKIKSKIRNEMKFESQDGGDQKIDGDWSRMNLLLDKLNDLDGLTGHIKSAVEFHELQQPEESAKSEEGEEEDEGDALQRLITNGFTKDVVLPGPDAKWKIKPGFSAQLTALHERLAELQAQKEQLQTRFQKQYGAPSLLLRHNPTHGLHVHISRPVRDTVKLNKARSFAAIVTNKTTKIYVNEDWCALGDSIIRTAAEIIAAEKDAFASLVERVLAESVSIRKNARIFDELDITSALASLASKEHYVRPKIDESISFNIEDGRHPTVELGLRGSGRMFAPNSISMSESSRLHIVTGPNMAGKSTYLRQIALIAILAQIGSFVPADYAYMGLVDKVFTRIGARDDLYRNQSTFMVEMTETADILKNATEKSLVIMDEVGRGTTVKDGLAIAFAVIQHLYVKNQCRALFATHFHEIVDMFGFEESSASSAIYPAIAFSCTDITENSDGRFSYSHLMRPGANRNSHGLKVAQLAGMPEFAIKIAEDALSSINSNKGHPVGSSLSDLRDIGLKLSNIRN